MKTLLEPPYVIAMPTETVYGLAARIDCPQGIEAIFKIKQRPFFDPLIVHVSSIEQARLLTSDWSQAAEALAQKFWPGPLTIVLPKSDLISDLITSGLTTVGLRMPNHAMALELIRQEGPLAAPSANKFGKTSPTSADHVRQEFLDQVPILDGGECSVGIESTVLLINDHKLSILRPGAITQSQIEKVLPKDHIFVELTDKSQSPGQMKHHYMPKVPLILSSGQNLDLVKIEKLLHQMPDAIDGVAINKPQNEIRKILKLELSNEPSLACRQLYGELRKISEKNPDLILFIKQDFHQGEAWQGLFDRLTKAASISFI